MVQTVDEIIADSMRLIEKYHDASFGSMHRIALAPCSPFSVSPELLRQSAILARQYGVRLHTHLCETKDEENYMLEREGMRPLAFMQTLAPEAQDEAIIAELTRQTARVKKRRQEEKAHRNNVKHGK